MQFTGKKKTGENIVYLMRRLGYAHQFYRDELVFARALERNGYPRFHLYIKENKDNIIFNLHLDQKRPTYKGSHAHSGEYDGPVVEQEAERIKSIIGV